MNKQNHIHHKAKSLIFFTVCFSAIVGSTASRAECSAPITAASLAGKYVVTAPGLLGVPAVSETTLVPNGTLSLISGDGQYKIFINPVTGTIIGTLPLQPKVDFPMVVCGAGEDNSATPVDFQGYSELDHLKYEFEREVDN